MQTSDSAVRLLGLRALVLDVVLTSDYATAEEKVICAGRVAACQRADVLLKWYTNSLRLLAGREESAPVLRTRRVLCWGLPYNGGASDTFMAVPEVLSDETRQLDYSVGWARHCKKTLSTTEYRVGGSRHMAFSLPNN